MVASAKNSASSRAICCWRSDRRCRAKSTRTWALCLCVYPIVRKTTATIRVSITSTAPAMGLRKKKRPVTSTMVSPIISNTATAASSAPPLVDPPISLPTGASSLREAFHGGHVLALPLVLLDQLRVAIDQLFPRQSLGIRLGHPLVPERRDDHTAPALRLLRGQ